MPSGCPVSWCKIGWRFERPCVRRKFASSVVRKFDFSIGGHDVPRPPERAASMCESSDFITHAPWPVERRRHEWNGRTGRELTLSIWRSLQVLAMLCTAFPTCNHKIRCYKICSLFDPDGRPRIACIDARGKSKIFIALARPLPAGRHVHANSCTACKHPTPCSAQQIKRCIFMQGECLRHIALQLGKRAAMGRATLGALQGSNRARCAILMPAEGLCMAMEVSPRAGGVR